VADRIANIIILGEDQEHVNLVRRYLLRVGQNDRTFRPVPLPGNRGCGSQHVREQFSKQVKECRGTLGRRTTCWLIVIADADDLTTAERERTLHAELTEGGETAVGQDEPIVILIPKWQVETWVKCLLGQAVSEDDRNTDRPPVTPTEIRDAARIAFDWARANAQIPATCVQSLTAALPRWRRIG
jgi:hypothetical protein